MTDTPAEQVDLPDEDEFEEPDMDSLPAHEPSGQYQDSGEAREAFDEDPDEPHDLDGDVEAPEGDGS